MKAESKLDYELKGYLVEEADLKLKTHADYLLTLPAQSPETAVLKIIAALIAYDTVYSRTDVPVHERNKCFDAIACTLGDCYYQMIKMAKLPPDIQDKIDRAIKFYSDSSDIKFNTQEAA